MIGSLYRDVLRLFCWVDDRCVIVRQNTTKSVEYYGIVNLVVYCNNPYLFLRRLVESWYLL